MRYGGWTQSPPVRQATLIVSVRKTSILDGIAKRVIASAMTVHAALGNGFQEVIYQRAMDVEMPFHDLTFEREKELPIYYREQIIGTRRVDFFVEGLVMVELKAIVTLEDVHLAQAINYLEAYQMEIGLLLNFGAKRLEFKRVHNNALIRDAHSSVTR